MVENETELISLKEKFEENSVLNFTYEKGGNKLAFLDINLVIENGEIKTSVYTKLTNNGEMLNFKSECPMKYKINVIKNMLHRAKKISSDQQRFDKEVNRLKQVFTNNNFPMEVIDKCIQSFQDKVTQHNVSNNKLKIFYQNQMNSQYKKDEKVMKDIIHQHVKSNNENEKLELIIYYKNLKTKTMIMKNNLTNNSTDQLSKSWAVYKYKCASEDCELPNPSYIGQTRNTITKRLEQHCIDGAIKEHNEQKHRNKINIENLKSNTIVVKQFNDLQRLRIYETLTILQDRPDINRQKDNFINPLKLFGRKLNRNTTRNELPTNQQSHNYNLRSRNPN